MLRVLVILSLILMGMSFFKPTNTIIPQFTDEENIMICLEEEICLK